MVDIKNCRIGDCGLASSMLAPSGVVEILEIQYSARALGGSIECGKSIVVAGADIGGLIVRPFVSEEKTRRLPGYGTEVFGSFGDRANAKAAQEEQERYQAHEIWRRKSRRSQRVLILVFACFAVGLLHDFITSSSTGWAVYPLLVGVFFSSVAGAAMVFRGVESVLRQFDEDFVKLTVPSVTLALAGTSFGLWSTQTLGISLGVSLAIVGTIAGAALVPVFSLLFLAGD